jgi:hypothetical protein
MKKKIPHRQNSSQINKKKIPHRQNSSQINEKENTTQSK